MAEFYHGTIPIIETDRPATNLSHPPNATFGLVPRDYAKDPESMFAPPSEMVLIPQSDWDARFDEQEATQSSLEHIYLSGPNGEPAFVNLDQDGDGFCLPADTRVRMADGTQKKIQDVKLLDKVVTAEGNVGRVKQCHVRDFIGELVTIKAHGHGHLRATPEHPVLTRRGYVPFGEVVNGDWISVPKHDPVECGIMLTSAHVVGVRRRVKNLTDGSAAFEFRIPDGSEGGVKHVPDFIRLNEGIGRIFGLWLAEGHIDKSTWSVIWSLGTHETDTLVAELVGLLESEFGIEARVSPGPAADTVTQVKFQGRMWCQLFASLCGTGVAEKRVHGDLMAGPKEFLKGLLSGWLDGDGCDRNPNAAKGYNHRQLCGATVSHDLALNMYDVATRLGCLPFIRKEAPQVNRYAKVRRPVWKVGYVPVRSDYRPEFRVEGDASGMWRRVREVVREPFTGPVFNIGVEGDNSYIAEGVGVHNCWSYSTGTSIMMDRLRRNLPPVRLNPHATAAIIKGGRDEGGWCGQSAKFGREVGYAVEGTGPGQWPLHSRNLQYDTPALRAEMAKYKIEEEWTDLTREVYDQNLTQLQVATCGFNNIPGPRDYNFWSHSVCGIRWVRIERGSWGQLILNSWKGWGRYGLGVLRGSQAVCNGGLAIRLTSA